MFFMQIEMKEKAGIAIFISEKIDFQIKAIIWDKEGYYIMIKGAIQQEYKMLINIYAPNIGAPKCIKKTLIDIKGDNEQKHSYSREF